MVALLCYWWMAWSMFAMPGEDPVEKFHILPSSTLEIQGSSNVNNFTCVFQMQDINTVTINYNPGTHKFESALVSFPVNSFDCGGRMINKDFRNLLNEKKHPTLKIRLVEIEPLEEDEVLVSLEFEIAGVKNLYKMPASFAIMKGYYSSQGHIELDIEDFGLEQPKKLLGAIVVHKKIDVRFKFDFV